MRRKKISPRFLIAIAVIAAVCVLSALYSGITGNPSPVTRVVGVVVTPFQKVAGGIGGFFGKGFAYFTEFDDLKAENEQLHQQLADMQQQVRDAQVAIEENNRLRAEHGLDERERDYSFVTAEIVGRNPGDWSVVLTLDKGSSQGVAVNNVVTTADGMVGYVSAVSSGSCEVTTVVDVEMQCGALVTRTRESAIAEGDYDLMTEGNLRLSYLKEDADVVIGDTVETSGDGGVFPKGIMIGTVEGVLPEPSGISYYAIIKPFVNVDAVTSVSIITDYTITE